MSYTDEEKKVVAHHLSDGTELIPAEVQANTRHEASSLPHEALSAGYTVNDEGLLNNYAIEPGMSGAEYPSSTQQRRYIVLGIAATLFVALAVWIAFAASHA